jgi:hypothetical protein
LVANVLEQTVVGEDHQLVAGTKKFAPGTKVYFHSAMWGTGGETVTVFGRHRGSRRMVKVTMPSRHLHNWRVKSVHKPGVAGLLADGEVGTEADARRLLDHFAQGR